MAKVIIVLSVLLVSLQSQAGVICGQVQRYGSSYAQPSCAEGYACVMISGKTYKFNEKTTSESVLDDLYFAFQKADKMNKSRIKNSMCLITNDKDGSLKAVAVDVLREA